MAVGLWCFTKRPKSLKSLQRSADLKNHSVWARRSPLQTYASDLGCAETTGVRNGALLLTNRALELDDNLAAARLRSGWVRAYAGDADGAIESLNKVFRLDPLDPRAFLTQAGMALAHFIAGRDDEAAEWAAKVLRLKPDWHPALRIALASNGLLGRRDEAERVLRLYVRYDPQVSITKICGFYPFRRDVDRQRLILGLRKAKVPERAP